MLSDLATIKTYLRIKPTTTENDALLVQRLPVADRMVKQFVKRDLETSVYQQFLSGMDEVDLPLPQRPIQAPVFSGTLTNGLPTVTGLKCLLPYPVAANGTVLTGTQNLMVGMPAAICASTGNNATLAPIPILTSILSVDSATQVTLTNNATQSGTFNIVFGIDLYLDNSSGFGDSPGAFSATTQFMLGLNCILKRDTNDGSSRRGLVQRTGGGPIGVGGFGWGWTGPYVGGGAMLSLTSTPLPRWPSGFGNIKVIWAAGLGIGAAPPSALNPNGGSLPANTTLPYELTDAVNKIAAWDRLTTPVGIPQDMETWSKGAMHQLNGEANASPEMVTVRGVLRRYRELSFGGV